MSYFDDGPLEQILREVLFEEGDMVFSKDWNSGGPGAGAGSELVYMWRKYYWAVSSESELSGPYESFEEVFCKDEVE